MTENADNTQGQVIAPKRGRSLLPTVAQVFVNQRIAEFASDKNITEAASERFGVVVTPEHLNYYRYDGRAKSKWQTFRDEHRKSWLADLASISLAHKKSRLLKLTNLFNRASELDQIGDATRVLEQIRKEIEGDNVRLSGDLNLTHMTRTPDEIVEAMLALTVGVPGPAGVNRITGR
jgi:hypothetical protein